MIAVNQLLFTHITACVLHVRFHCVDHCIKQGRVYMFAHDNRLDFWIVNEMKNPLLAPLAQDLLSALHLKHTWNVCSQSVQS